MTIYIDLVMVLNFLFDFILLCSVNYILRRNIKLLRLIISGMFGEVTLLLLFINMNNFLLIISKIIFSVLMIIICFGYKDLKYFFKNILYFYLVSMLLGGAIEFLNNQFSYTNKGLVFTDNGLGISYGIILAISLFLYFKYIKSFKNLKNNYSLYYRCRIYIDKDNSFDVNAFLDTGNKLEIPYLGKSIVLVDKIKINDIKVDNPIYVPFNSLNNHGLLECYKCLKLEIDGKVFDKFLLGVSNERFYMDGIDCIINNSVMEGLR